jgi:cation diffusion facilitator family transporter
MGNQPQADLRLGADREKRRVALSSLLAAVALTLTKLVVGLWTNSLGILAEAAHSGLDLLAAAMTLWAVRVSAQPADRQHTYGHGKFENLSALGETLLLLATCVGIVYESIRRLWFAGGVELTVNAWAFAVVILSIVVDFSRSRALSRAAKKHHSQALEADALHFSTDIWSSLVVLLGLCGVAVGRALAMPWLDKADAVAALGVATIVVWISLQLGKRSVDDLLDSIPRDLQERVAGAAAGVAEVVSVKQVRLRRSGPDIFADVTLTVSHAASFEKSHEIADRAEAAVRAVLPRADVVVHIEPVAAPEEDVLTTIRVLAARHGLGAHGIRIYEEEGGRRAAELHLEVSESLSLDEAHRQATAFEEELRAAAPGVARVVTHLEPTGGASSTVQAGCGEGRPPGEAMVRAAIEEFLAASPSPLAPHEVQVQLAGGELQVSFHCALDRSLAITAAHELTQQLEKHLRQRVPSLGRVVIHVEPV